MQNTTPLFPGFHLPTLRNRPRSSQQELADELTRIRAKSFSQLGACFEKYIPNQILLPAKTGEMSCRRIYSKEDTFWAFFSQLPPDVYSFVG